jgi:hypothetical protein
VSGPIRHFGRRRRHPALVALALVLGFVSAFALADGLPGSGRVAPAAALSSPPEVTAQTDDSLPAHDVTMIGSSPTEAPNETWGIGEVGLTASNEWHFVRYSSTEGWSMAPGPLDASGQPLAHFVPDHTALAAAITPGGAGVLLGSVGQRQILLARNPGGAFQEVAPVPTEGEEALLSSEEVLYGNSRTPLLAPLEEGGHAGALLVPVSTGPNASEDRVLHWDGEHWSVEPIEMPTESQEVGGFRVLAIAASEQQAWLLAQLSSASNAVALFHRHEGHWGEVAPAGPLTAPAPQPGEPAPFTVPGTGEPPASSAQILTVTGEGVWIDGERTDAHTPVTMFFKPAGEEHGVVQGEVRASWCDAPGGNAACTYSLPEPLPTVHARSFAWANPATPFGERVITGLHEGVSLRLEGTSFKRVLALGGSEPPNDVGGTLGAAFSNAREGWLGNSTLPVHLTLDPAPNRLTDYPVPFRRALTAIAPQPGVPVGALSSEAIAVGDQGEVARYEPGEGWQPESLFGVGGQVQRPRLRAIAWPTPQRAYAVGELGQMWLWRGETGLWEPDPAAPLSFRGNLLGIAFAPGNSSLGYAVGQQGVLLRYGKTWTQEALPPEVAGASFTSIAFAGSEAIVAYRQIHLENGSEGTHYTGGLLVNEGSGWHVDQGAAQALGGEVPWAVAGLPDGGAAVSATPGGFGEGAMVVERQSQGAPWGAAPSYPDGEAPGSLALFREGGALRAVASGGVPPTLETEDERQPPAGFPPNLIRAYPLATGYVLRQTAAGWNDEEHEANSTRDPLGEYKFYDMVYQPDPTAAVLVDATGAQGWAVGGSVEERETDSGRLDTADVARYPAEGVAPPGLATAAVPSSSQEAAFAIGGGAQCLAPCAARANARLGPDVWLSSALEQTQRISGVRGFLYTGPHVTSGEGHGAFLVPYSSEFGYYAELLSGSLPTFAAPAPSDRGAGNECGFHEVFGGYPYLTNPTVLDPSEPCASYYSWISTGPQGNVRVIVLDDSSDVDEAQQVWLAAQLHEAANGGEPAIAIGNADLSTQISAGDQDAVAVANILVDDGASAYFYDAPEQNVRGELRAGSRSIPMIGSGTLGYVSAIHAEEQDFIGHMGFLLAEVGVAARNPSTNVAPVQVRLIPNIGELALEAKEGLLLRRSTVALFDGLARRPRAGGRSSRQNNQNETAQYIPIPANCVGNRCASGILPEYSFSSSNPQVGDFVEPNLAAAEGSRTVLLGVDEKPIHDPSSGLFCAYNAGKTVVTITAGGLAASLAVTVQPGSVRRPCGTVPLTSVAAQQASGAPVPPPAPSPAPASSPPASSPPPVPLPPPPAVTPPPAPARAPAAHPATFFVPPVLATPLLAFVPPPVPSPARPSPPTGTSAVSSPVEIAEHEEEEEEATESVSNQAFAYSPGEHEPSPLYVLGIVILAAFAGATARRRMRPRGRRGAPVQMATLSSARVQRRLERGVGRRW